MPDPALDTAGGFWTASGQVLDRLDDWLLIIAATRATKLVPPVVSRPIGKFFGFTIGSTGEITGVTPIVVTNAAPQPVGFVPARRYGLAPNYYLPADTGRYLPSFIPGVPEQRAEDAARHAVPQVTLDANDAFMAGRRARLLTNAQIAEQLDQARRGTRVLGGVSAGIGLPALIAEQTARGPVLATQAAARAAEQSTTTGGANMPAEGATGLAPDARGFFATSAVAIEARQRFLQNLSNDVGVGVHTLLGFGQSSFVEVVPQQPAVPAQPASPPQVVFTPDPRRPRDPLQGPEIFMGGQPSTSSSGSNTPGGRPNGIPPDPIIGGGVVPAKTPVAN